MVQIPKAKDDPVAVKAEAVAGFDRVRYGGTSDGLPIPAVAFYLVRGFLFAFEAACHDGLAEGIRIEQRFIHREIAAKVAVPDVS